MAEVLGDETRISELLAQPGRGRVAERVRRDPLLEACTLDGAVDDRAECRLLEAAAGESTEDGLLRPGASLVSETAKLVCETGRKRLASRLSTLAPTYEKRRCRALELEVAPVESAEL